MFMQQLLFVFVLLTGLDLLPYFFSFYGDYPYFVIDVKPWIYHGGQWNNGGITGGFAFTHWIGAVNNNNGSWLSCESL